MSNVRPPQVEAPHDGHGNSPAAWAGVAIISAATVVAGLAVVFGAWIVFGIAAVAGPIIGCLVWKLMADAARQNAHTSAH
jgi:hypothetical protein